MKAILYPLCMALIAPMFVGCNTTTNPADRTVFRLEEGPRPNPGGSRYGYRGTEGDPSGTGGGTQVLPGGDQDPGGTGDPGGTLAGGDPAAGGGTVDDPGTPGGGTTEPAPEPDITPAAPSDKPVATQVPGKYGVVYSPFAPGREVNVKGYSPGTEVRCPYTQKIFRVP